MKQLLAIFLFVVSVMGTAQNNSLFEEGNAFYNEGKYQEAIKKYETILKNGQHSAALYFNLANANYKLNKVAPSIYYYEKALLLNPNDKDIKSNIVFANNMTIDDIDVVPEVGFSKITKGIINTMSFDNWAKLAIAGVFLFVVLFLAYHFSYATSKKRIAFVVSIVSLLVACCSVAIAFQKYSMDSKDQPAIVFAQESRVKAEPNLRSEEAFKLHEGTKVKVLDTIDNWKKIKIADGTTGWIASDDIRLLKDF